MGSRGLASSQHLAGLRAYQKTLLDRAQPPLICSLDGNGRLFSCFPVHHVMEGQLPESTVRALQVWPILEESAVVQQDRSVCMC